MKSLTCFVAGKPLSVKTSLLLYTRNARRIVFHTALPRITTDICNVGTALTNICRYVLQDSSTYPHNWDNRQNNVEISDYVTIHK